jgi:hypothetical protein
MRFSLRTLVILVAILPPLIGFWPNIKRRVIARATQITASDVAVLIAASSVVAFRVRLHYASVNHFETVSRESADPSSGSSEPAPRSAFDDQTN